MKKKKIILKIASIILVACCICSFPFTSSAETERAGEDIAINTFSYTVPSESFKVKVASRFKDLFFGGNDEEGAKNADEILLCPGGDAFGAKICGVGVTVVRIRENTESCPLMQNDKIEKINGSNISTIDDVKNILKSYDGSPMTFDIIRGNKKIKLSITPTLSNGEYHLGVILTDGAAGIGTITYINPKTGSFGGLGHGICSSETGKVLDMTRGEVTGVILGGAVRGEAGKPGELRGVLTDKSLGTIELNTECGVFGKLSQTEAKALCHTEAMKVGKKSELHEGDATIISTVKNGMRSEYKIQIKEIDFESEGTKSFKIEVTDPMLIAISGGIVRGMSGSPIIQDGKLVGAVTHVMVANPTEGYGIFIENMLNAAQGEVVPKAA